MRAAGGESHFYLVLLDLHASPAVEEVRKMVFFFECFAYVCPEPVLVK